MVKAIDAPKVKNVTFDLLSGKDSIEDALSHFQSV